MSRPKRNTRAHTLSSRTTSRFIFNYDRFEELMRSRFDTTTAALETSGVSRGAYYQRRRAAPLPFMDSIRILIDHCDLTLPELFSCFEERPK